MKTSILLSITLIIALSVFFAACEVQKTGCTDPRAYNYDVSADIDDNSCIYDFDYNSGDCLPVQEGNLSITNQTGEVLFLYNNLVFKTCIPSNAENFIVNIPNEDLLTFKLQIWKASDVQDKFSTPDMNSVYRQWNIALSNTSDADERANWLITSNDDNDISGTLELNYPATDNYGHENIYQVDVLLNSKNGAKLASLQPGITDKKVSVDYGVHYIYFRYWFSDPDSKDGNIQELGWNQIEGIVINHEFESSEISIPVYYSNVGKYGELKVTNTTDNPVSIYANDKMIESIAKVDGSTEGLSIIPSNSNTTFLIPVNSYNIYIKTFNGSTTIQNFNGVKVYYNETAHLFAGGNYVQLSIQNSTNESLLLFSPDKEYLGVTVEPGVNSGIVQVPGIWDSLMVITPDRTKYLMFEYSENVTINNLSDYRMLNLKIIQSWSEIGSNHFQSNTISSNESTKMQAVLTNDESAEISFQYKVSSEPGYDLFSFTINGIKRISNISGEVQWTNFVWEIPPGEHTLEWVYEKDQRLDEGNDNVEIKNIELN